MHLNNVTVTINWQYPRKSSSPDRELDTIYLINTHIENWMQYQHQCANMVERNKYPNTSIKHVQNLKTREEKYGQYHFPYWKLKEDNFILLVLVIQYSGVSGIRTKIWVDFFGMKYIVYFYIIIYFNFYHVLRFRSVILYNKRSSIGNILVENRFLWRENMPFYHLIYVHNHETSKHIWNMISLLPIHVPNVLYISFSLSIST